MTFNVIRNGGGDKPVEIQYEGAQFRSKFSVLYKLGKTAIDYDEIKKR